jgi:hypothetical protein
MPTGFIAQSGAALNQNTHIEVEGCSSTLSVVSKSVRGKTITLKVAVPAGGKVTASGKGVASSSKTSKGRETISVTLHQKNGGKLRTKVKLTFVPSKGKKQSKTIDISFKR